MKSYLPRKIRNVALLGHSGSGKTTLTEAMLYYTGQTKRQGRIEDGNTVSDYSKEEIARKISLSTAVIPIEWGEYKYNFLDTPGYYDFYGEMYGAKRATEGSVLVVDASSGVEVGTEKTWKNLEKYKTPRYIYLNKMDKENVDFDKVVEELQTELSEKIIPLALPIFENGEFSGYIDVIDEKAYMGVGKEKRAVEVPEDKRAKVSEIRESLMEMAAESDEELLDKFFGDQDFDLNDIRKGLRVAVRESRLAPLIVGSATEIIGTEILLEAIAKYFPSPITAEDTPGTLNGNIVGVKMDENGPFSALVFKTIVDPYVGKLSFFKVISGKLKKGMEVYNTNRDRVEKIGAISHPKGKSLDEVSELSAGDIGATAKLEFTKTGDTLAIKEYPVRFDDIEYPEASLYMAVFPKNEGDDDKLGASLSKLQDEDPTLVIERNSDTHELLIGGQGNMELAVVVEKLKNNFGVDVELKNPTISYKETIKARSDVQGKHKKQSGGAGQYGDVHIRFEPSNEDFVFAEDVFGGSVPRNFFPAVEKGLRDSLEHGVLAGFPVVNIKATLYDGSYHPVDSNETAFRIAASLAFKKGMEEAKPVLLEPIRKYIINIPDAYLGDVMGDMNKRRGKILGMEQQSDGTQKLIAEAPHAEMFEYSIDLRAMTQARGSFTSEFLRYEEVPQAISQKIIEKRKQQI